MPTPDDVRIMTPRVRRALDPGVDAASAASAYTDDMIKDITADAVGELILCAGDAFPYSLVVSSADASGFPVEYITVPELPIEVQNLVAIQAAITQTIKDLHDVKTSERISDEGSTWEYSLSPTIFRDKLKTLQDQLKCAIDELKSSNLPLDRFINTLEQRDETTSRLVEPWYYENQ